ncbi:hypothetical protein DFQ28_006991 [Apophysomyces sp. BC1034]|nr:hypothetical protein DFQ28_006991 [Apophysomyces sp. BC1034]
MEGTQERKLLCSEPANGHKPIVAQDKIMTPLERVVMLSKSDLDVHRLLLVKELANTLQEVTIEEALQVIFPMVQELVTDADDTVRETFVSGLDKIILYFYKNAPPRADLPDHTSSRHNASGSVAVVPPNDNTVDDPPSHPLAKDDLHIPARSFAPLLIECLLDQNSVLAVLGQQCVVSIAKALESEHTPLGQRLLDSEIYDGIVMGLMAIVNGKRRLSHTEHSIPKDTVRRPSVPGFEAKQPEPEEDQDDANLAKMTCLSVMAALAGALGPERCIHQCLPIVEQMASDPMFYVRKEAAAAVGSIAVVVKTVVTEERLLALYQAFMNDSIWHVRRACALTLPQICGALPSEHKNQIAVEGVEHFKNDVSRNVRNALAEIMGELIATFLPDDWETTRTPGKVPEPLLEFFLSLGANDNQIFKLNVDQAMTCAYSFPAVVLTAGVGYWDSHFKDTYLDLTKDYQAKVRSTFAHSLHEIARIIGPERTERDLVQIFALYLMDLDEVKEGVLNHLADFLAILATNTRNEYIPILAEVWDGVMTNWRLRDILAVQLCEITMLFDASRVVEHILPLAIRACTDGYAAVRKRGVAMFPAILQVVKKAVDLEQDDIDALVLLSQVTERLDAFARAESYRERLVFAQICQVLLNAGIGGDDFSKFFLPRLCPLAYDPVVNVRIAASYTIRMIYQQGDFRLECKKAALDGPDTQEHGQLLEDALYHLKTDADQDVRLPILDFVDLSRSQQHTPIQQSPSSSGAHGSSPRLIDDEPMAEAPAGNDNLENP